MHYCQVNNNLADNDYSFMKLYFESNLCNIISKRFIELNSSKGKDNLYHLYHHPPLSLPILIKELYVDKDIALMIEYFYRIIKDQDRTFTFYLNVTDNMHNFFAFN